MGSILDLPLALLGGSLIGAYEGSQVIGSADLAVVMFDVIDGAVGSLYTGS